MTNLVVKNEEAKGTVEQENEMPRSFTSAAETLTTQSESKEPDD